ncbi:MAG: DEAD/DEAH box helicase [Pseudomonadales bacterium]|nr:DEAD/DEAH box helicase [Pseudomonadales bacterium]
MSQPDPVNISFRDLALPDSLLAALDQAGYETPSPIQAETIPHLMQGLDLVGHAPTGTGKTAAFALPLLSRIDLKQQQVQVMVLTPTRELAIQVAEAFQRYASKMKGFHVLPIYGGQPYSGQIRQLKRGVQAVVGTPGRVMDHMRKGTLSLSNLQALVLDEADEMLRMGFLDDVEWILEQMPTKRQIALFSATMPKQIQHIARRHLDNPREISIKSKTATAETIRQRFWQVSHTHKLDALTRILEVEPFDAMIMFVRTKTATVELAEKLQARGYAAEPINGDMQQKNREQTIDRLKKGKLDILVATDVAARGLDVERISHVINYDIPYDAEAYIHRIGRTGRAGRTGDAILFVTPRERRMLGVIEKTTRKKIEALELPTTEMVNNKRIADFKQRITDVIASGSVEFMQGLLTQYQQEHDVPAIDIAAALAKMYMGEKSLLLKDKPLKSDRPNSQKDKKLHRKGEARGNSRGSGEPRLPRRSNAKPNPPEGMERFRIEVGHDHEVQPGNIVGAIVNEAGIDGEHVGHIDIQADFSMVDLPAGMPKDIFRELKKTWVCGRRLNISRINSAAKGASEKRDPSPHGSRRDNSRRDDSRRDDSSRGGSGRAGSSKKKSQPHAKKIKKSRKASIRGSGDFGNKNNDRAS